MKKLENYLDEQGRVRVYPSKRQDKHMVLHYLATKFNLGRRYSEIEVNTVLQNYHTFEDWALLRRDLFELGYFKRNRDGSAYWLAKN